MVDSKATRPWHRTKFLDSRESQSYESAGAPSTNTAWETAVVPLSYLACHRAGTESFNSDIFSPEVRQHYREGDPDLTHEINMIFDETSGVRHVGFNHGWRLAASRLFCDFSNAVYNIIIMMNILNVSTVVPMPKN
jgi:hypothetical protein